MIQVLNANKKNSLKDELRKDFPALTDSELNHMDESVESLVSSISVKVQRDEQEIARLVEEKMVFINSKTI